MGSRKVAATGIKYDIPPPDSEEELLAKAVFGDTTHFHSELAGFDLEDLLDGEDAVEEEAEEEDGGNDEETGQMEQVNDDQLFFVDDGEEQENVEDEDVDMDQDEEAISEISSDDAWNDSDDEKIHVSIVDNNLTKKLRTSYNQSSISGNEYIRRLRAQFEKIYARPQWADNEEMSDHEDDDDDGDESVEQVINGDVNALSKILEKTYEYKDTSSTKLLPMKQLNITRLKDANMTHPSQSAIQSLSFHPTKPLLLTGGYDKTLRIYHIDGKSNQLVSSVYLTGTPIQTCTFYVSVPPNKKNQEQKILSGGRRRYMHSWDLNSSTSSSIAKIDKISRLYGHEDTQRSFEKFKTAHYCHLETGETHGIILLQGSNGWINILNSNTSIWMMGCKIEGNIADFCLDYIPLGQKNRYKTVLIAVNTYGEAWEFDLNSAGKTMNRWKDQGGVGITAIQVGGGNATRQNRWLAIGSASGYVNVYDRFSATPHVPVSVLDQLTTTVSQLEFSVDGQILAMASRATKDALRLVHLPSCTVFANWPTSGTPLGKVTSLAFSPRSELLAVGNEQGKVRLWRLNHY